MRIPRLLALFLALLLASLALAQPAPGLTRGAADRLYTRIEAPRFDGVLPAPVIAGRHFRATSFQAVSGNTSQRFYKLYQLAPTIRLIYTNWAAQGSPNERGVAPLTVKLGVNWFSGSTKIHTSAVTWNGATSVTIPALGYAVSDPVDVPLTVVEGDYLATRTYVTYDTGTYGAAVPCNNDTWAQNGLNEGYQSGDYTDGTNSFGGSTNTYVFGPSAVVGWPLDRDNRTVALVGDSIPSGTGAQITAGLAGPVGYALQGFHDAGVPHILFPRGGETAATFAGYAGSAVRWQYVRGARIALCTYGTNDLGVSSLATLKSDLIKIWRGLANRGARVYQATLTPRTKSLDNWLTAGPGNGTTTGQYAYELSSWSASMSQTVELQRQALNQWLRAPRSAGAGNSALVDAGGALTGILDTGKTLEVNADGSAIAISAATGAISNGSGGYWKGAGTVLYSGTSTSWTSAQKMNDTGAAWVANAYLGQWLVVGTQAKQIALNTSTQITADTFSPTPDAASAYQIRPIYTSDGIHPAHPGHLLMAAAVTAWITPLVSSPLAMLPPLLPELATNHYAFKA